jgi:DNA polymerase-3 subunit delta
MIERVPALKPAYLIHGDDHGAVGERRVRLQALARRDDGAVGVERLGTAKPADLARALAASPLGAAQRVIVVEGVERWREAEVKEHLLAALAEIPAKTTVALFACERGTTKAPAALHKAVRAAGGQVVREATLKPAQLPAWVSAQARSLGLSLDRDAASALVERVGERKQRLLRELEKLALAVDEPRRVGAEEVAELASSSAQEQAFGLADALVGGRVREATLLYSRLHAQGERTAGLVYMLAARLRQALDVALRLERGESAGAVRRGLRMPSHAAERLITDACEVGPARLRSALAGLADLELHTRGGPIVSAQRPHAAALEEHTLTLLAIESITARH